jgi:uncharacterized protein
LQEGDIIKMEQKLEFYNSNGSKLCGILSSPKDDNSTSTPIIILAHGFSTNKNSTSIVALSENLNRKEIATFRFDFYGHGESEGKFEDITVSEGVDDILSAVKFLKAQGYSKIGLMGSSFGGICSILAASKSKDIFVLALKSPVSNFVEVQKLGLSEKEILDWKNDGTRIYCPKRKLNLDYTFYEDIQKLDVYLHAKKIEIPTIIVHGDKDEIVPIQQSYELVKSIETSKLFIIKDADHRYSDKQSFDAVIRIISDFIEENI